MRDDVRDSSLRPHPSSLLDDRMGLNLEFEFWPGKGRYADKGKCWKLAGRKPRPQGFPDDGSFLRLVRHDIDDECRDVSEGRSRCREGSAQVLENLLGLRAETSITSSLLVCVDADLTRYVDQLCAAQFSRHHLAEERCPIRQRLWIQM